MDNLLQYTDKLFFYCLKKTGNRYDAEEITSITILEVLTSISNNKIINDLEKYLFIIANNQYNRYIKNKINVRNHETGFDDYLADKLFDESHLVKDKIFEEEQYKFLKVQIQTLSSEYLHILYGYYVEDKTIKKISEEMSLPLGTVNRKLFELRNKLMEGVKMERLNGKKAYIPTNYEIIMSGHTCIDFKKYVTSLLSKNLLAHSYDNPCTLEDFALELGVSMPYIEDFVFELSKIKFLKEINKGVYVTNIPFVSADFHKKVLSYVSINSKTYLDGLYDFCIRKYEQYKKIVGLKIDDSLLMWSLMFYVNQFCENRLSLEYNYEFQGPGYDCDYIFDERITDCDCKKSLLYRYSCNSGYDEDNKTWYMCWPCDSAIEWKTIYDKLNYPNSIQGKEVRMSVLKKLYNLHEKVFSTLNDLEKSIVLKSSEDNYVKVVNDIVNLNLVYLPHKKYKLLTELIDNDETIEDLSKELEKLSKGLTKLVRDYIPSYLLSRVDFISRTEICVMRAFVVDYFMERGKITIPNENKKFVYSGIFWEKDYSKN